MNRIWWSSHDIGSFVKGFACLVLVGILMIPTSQIAPWVSWVILILIGLLAIYCLYIYLAVFYIIEDNQLTVFGMWKFLHFKYSDIKKIEPIEGKFKNCYGWGKKCIRIQSGKYEFCISPKQFDEFLEKLRKAKNDNAIKTITKGGTK